MTVGTQLGAGLASPGNRLPVRARSRRPTLILLAVLLILVGALASALLAYRSGSRTDVLVAAGTILPGQQISAGDFGIARVAVDTGAVVPATRRGALLGSYATVRIPAGTLVNQAMFATSGIVPDDAVVVGLDLAVSQRPASGPQVGDVVRIYLAPTGAQSSGGSTDAGAAPVAAGRTLVEAARVTDVGDSGTSSGSTLTVSVMVTEGAAEVVVPLAAQNQLGVSVLPADARPAVDFAT